MGILLYAFTLVITFALIVGLPIIIMGVVETSVERQWSERRKYLWIFLLAYGGFITGSAFAWSLRPFACSLPFWETAYAGVRADIYGHEVEHVAERIFLFVIFCGDLGAILAGIAGLIVRKYRLRRSLLRCDPV